MKHIIPISIALACAIGTQAAPLTEQQAQTAAESFWQHTLRQSTAIVDRSAEWQYADLRLYCAKEGGFVIVAADDAARPIVGYSTSNRVDPTDLPVQLGEWLDQCQRQIAIARELGINPTPEVAASWQTLLQGGTPLPKAGDSDGVGPLLTTLWDQYTPYNLQCPNNTVTGCAATAQAQMMKYWNWPVVGYGNHSYVHSQYGTLSVDYAASVYDWQHMPDSVDMLLHSEREQQAVAQLMYHVGVSLDMEYATAEQGGSAAAGLAGIPGYASMDNSLKDYFGYSPAMQVITKGFGYTDDSWRDTLMAELDRSHPILYTGVAPQGGHGFVCDGYDSLLMMHFNFGWSGEGNGFYAIGAITPGIGPNGQLGQYDFSSSNQALIGAVPIYQMRLADTTCAFVREGGVDSVLFVPNPMVNATWSINCDADWLTVTTHDTLGAVVIKIEAGENNSGQLRVGTITCTQGSETATLHVSQDLYGLGDYCPITVVMTSTRDGWLGGAELQLRSEGGLLYGTAQLAGGHKDSVQIAVSPLPLRLVWHSGGGTDRYLGYTVKDPYGVVRVEVTNAFHDAHDVTIAAPCHNLGIEDAQEPALRLYASPNPASESVEVLGADVRRLELMDVAGRTLRTSDGSTMPLAGIAPGVMLLRATLANGHTHYLRLAVQ